MAPNEYHECRPPGALGDLVECVWQGSDARDATFSILPDGCIDVVFVLGADARCLAFGTSTHRLEFPLEARADYFGVRFRPGMARHAVPLPALELVDGSAELAEFVGLTPDRFAEIPGFSGRSTLALAALHRRFATRAVTLDEVDSVVRQLFESRGALAVEVLGRRANLSARQLERRFLDRVGLSPKRLSRIARAQAARAAIERTPPRHLAHLAALFGYSDQSHLGRDFRELFGAPPSSFSPAMSDSPEPAPSPTR